MTRVTVIATALALASFACAGSGTPPVPDAAPLPAPVTPPPPAPIDPTPLPPAAVPDAGVAAQSPALGGSTPCDYRVVGYGQTSNSGSFGKRKSGEMCVMGQDAFDIFAMGDGTGTCTGDGGGPLFVNRHSTILGVLVVNTEGCHKDTNSTFLAVSPHRKWIDDTLAAAPMAEDSK